MMTAGEEHGPFFVRLMKPEDVGEVAVLERELFADAWSERMLRDGMASAAQQFFCLRTHDGRLAGYAAMLFVPDEGELLRIGITGALQRQGAASLLMEKILETAVQKQISVLFLEVREGNRPAIGLYEKYGFVRAGVRKGYYHGPEENALLMTRTC